MEIIIKELKALDPDKVYVLEYPENISGTELDDLAEYIHAVNEVTGIQLILMDDRFKVVEPTQKEE